MVRKEIETAIIKAREKEYYRHYLSNLAQIKGFQATKTDEQLELDYTNHQQNQMTKFKTEKLQEYLQKMETTLQELYDKHQIQQRRETQQTQDPQQDTCTLVWNMLGQIWCLRK